MPLRLLTMQLFLPLVEDGENMAKELKQINLMDEEAYKIKMQEAQLIIEQLIWLTTFSENIVKPT